MKVQILILFTLKSAIFFQFLTLNFQIFEIFPQKMLILTILSQRIGILDNFPLLKVKNMGKLSGSVGNFERKLGSYKDLKAKYTATLKV